VGRELYGVSAVPVNFWINRAGIVVDSSGSEGAGALERKTARLVAGP
jgi:hypothetical protein